MRLVTFMVWLGCALVVFGTTVIESPFAKLGAAILFGTAAAMAFEHVLFGQDEEE